MVSKSSCKLIVKLLIIACLPLILRQSVAIAHNNVPSKVAQIGEAWQIEVVTDVFSGGFYRPSLALDSQGDPKLSFTIGEGEDHLAFASRDSAGWHTETLDTYTRTITSLSLALDPDDYPYIGYVVYQDGLHLTYKDLFGWQTERIEDTCISCSAPSLALAGIGYPHISYYDEEKHELKYTYQDPLGWHTEKVADVEELGKNTSLKLDQYGYPIIGFYDAANLKIKYAFKDEIGWHIRVIDEQESNLASGYISLDLDHVGQPHFIYHNNYFDGLKYARLSGDSFWIQTVTSPYRIGPTNGLALDKKDRPIVSYSDYEEFGVGAAYGSCAGWQTEMIENLIGGNQYSVPIAVSDEDIVFVSYVGKGPSLKIATKQLPNLPVWCVQMPLVEKPFPIFIPPGNYPVDRCNSVPLIVQGNNEGTLRECVTSVEVLVHGFMQFNFSWTTYLDDIPYIVKYSDSMNPDMYIRDNVGNRYNHVQVGGGAAETVSMHDGETVTGWFLFQPAKEGASVFTFYDDDTYNRIDNINLSP